MLSATSYLSGQTGCTPEGISGVFGKLQIHNSFRIEGPAFIYVDYDTGQLSTILGYPTHLLK